MSDDHGPSDPLDDLLRRDAARVQVRPSPGFEQRVLAAVRRRQRVLRWFRPLALAAAAGLALTVAALATMPAGPAQVTLAPATAARTAPALPAIDLDAALDAAPAPLVAEAAALRNDLGRAAGALAGMVPTLPGM